MNKTIVGVIIGTVAISGIGAVILMNKEDAPAISNTSQHSDSETNAGDSLSQSNSSEANAQITELTETNEVSIMDFRSGFDFEYAQIKVKKGTTVKWTNQSSTKHDVTPEDATDGFKASNLLSNGESYEVTFSQVGEFGYFCSPHPFMRGKVIVTE